MKIIVTGCAGFIGGSLCKSLLDDGFEVLGIDNLNSYYSVKLKEKRLNRLKSYNDFSFLKLDISDNYNLKKVFQDFSPKKVINLAAQAGVRYSLKNPSAYIKSNVEGFMNILECCRYNDVEGLIYASSSSVYGGNEKSPFSVEDRVENPISIYAATKRANELMAKTYSHLYNLNTTGLRFFTVYGPWGRPDMAMFIFSKKIMEGKKVPLFNRGKMMRDFTYIDDIVHGIRLSLEKNYNCEIFNLGNNKSEDLMDIIKIIESELGKKANLDLIGMQMGDVKKTFADIEYTKKMISYDPKVSIKEGVPRFIKWFVNYSE